METRAAIAIATSLSLLAILSSCSFNLSDVGPFLVSSASRWKPTTSLVIPGGTGLKHCDDALDPVDDLFDMYRLMISPARPVLGHNISITAMGRFRGEVSANATNVYFVDADHAALVGWGEEDFCNNTRVFQTVDGVLGPTCPPVEGHALLRRDIHFDEWWPAGEWHVRMDVRNGTTGNSSRLLCVEGDLRVNQQRQEQSLPRRASNYMLPRSFWTRME